MGGCGSITWVETNPLHNQLPRKEETWGMPGFHNHIYCFGSDHYYACFSSAVVTPMQVPLLPPRPKVSYAVNTFDLVQNVFQSLLALHRESEINLNKSVTLVRPAVPGRFPQRQTEPVLLRSSLARLSALLVSVCILLKRRSLALLVLVFFRCFRST